MVTDRLCARLPHFCGARARRRPSSAVAQARGQRAALTWPAGARGVPRYGSPSPGWCMGCTGGACGCAITLVGSVRGGGGAPPAPGPPCTRAGSLSQTSQLCTARSLTRLPSSRARADVGHTPPRGRSRAASRTGCNRGFFCGWPWLGLKSSSSSPSSLSPCSPSAPSAACACDEGRRPVWAPADRRARHSQTRSTHRDRGCCVLRRLSGGPRGRRGSPALPLHRGQSERARRRG